MLIRIGIIACIAILGANGQEWCPTTSGRQGICISLAKCGSLRKLLDEFTDPATLKDSLCGLDGTTPKVCCPEQTPMQTTPPTMFKPSIDRISQFPDPPDVSNHPKLRLINDDICGSITESKIIGGNKTTVLEFPWMALLGYSFERRFTVFFCGGTLINKRYVLTAAHCVTGLKPGHELSGVRVGDHDLTKAVDCDEDTEGPPICADKYQNFFFERIHVHDGYHPPGLENDIALIRLDGDADFRPANVKPICLPVGDTANFNSNKAIVTGWGITEHGYRSPDLLKVRLDIADNDKCAAVWRQSNQVEVTHKQLCAGGKNRKDSCGGDSGGPLQYPSVINGIPKYVQYGIVSFGTLDCAAEGYPGVYTKVSYYMKWILDTITE